MDILAHPDFAKAMREQGYTEGQTRAVADLARHAADQATERLLAVCKHAAEGDLAITLLAALTYQRSRIDACVMEAAAKIEAREAKA